mmetsp:Transcript_75539/g.245634  ORF Transcript_75539/g.245634 Transcript_75539/m.245634 type:complete len:471 (+) Transcript_75539:70-1482(+)
MADGDLIRSTSSSQEDAAGSFDFDLTRCPQFGDFEDERHQRRDSGHCPTVVVKNSFLDIDDRPPTPQALVRARTTPPGFPAAGMDRDDMMFSDDLTSPPMDMMISRYKTCDSLENRQEWSWQGGPALSAVTALPSSIPSSIPSPSRAAGPALLVGVPAAAVAVAQSTAASGMTLDAGVYSGQPLQMFGLPMDCRSGMPMMPAETSPSGTMLQPAQPSLGDTQWQGHEAQPLQPQQPQQMPMLQPCPPQQPQLHQPPPSTSTPSRIRLVADSIHVESPSEMTSMFGQSGGASGSGDLAGLSHEPPPQPQTLTRHQSPTGYFRVIWTVDARKLRGNDKGAVSPPFELSFGDQFPNVTFKMMLYPKVVNDAKGGSSFKRAHGRGYVQLKCEEGLPPLIANVNYRISIGSGNNSNMTEPRGPVPHNFSSNAVCGLPKEQEEWDFSSVVDQNSQTFVVCLEIVPDHLVQSGGQWR